MTQKEKLLKELKEVQYDLALEKGETPQQIVESHLAWEAKKYTVRDLKEDIEYAKECLAKAKQAKAVEAYFATPEGAKRKRILEEGREANIEAMKKNRDMYIAEAKALIEPMLPENWKMDCTEVSYIKIYLTDPVDGKNVFGHDFELRLSPEWTKEDKTIFTLTTNMGTMGSFDPTKDIERVSLYRVFADIVSNRRLMNDLESIMIQADASKMRSHENIRNINNQLQNPLA